MTDAARSPALAAFEKMLAAGKDGALLRYSLGSEHLKSGDAATAAVHFAKAVALDPRYTAAWKLYARALADTGHVEDALAAYARGIAVAAERGDKQAEKEMTVFSRRLSRARETSPAAGGTPESR
jgi:predicted Zn-dependent protease